jgi:hypothetical protein
MNFYQNNPLLKGEIQKTDENLVKYCTDLHNKTLVQPTASKSKNSMQPRWYDVDEFSQYGLKQCVNFCMRLPGNRDLSTEDRAKLLKYGAYEIALLRLAMRFDVGSNEIRLSDGSTLVENDLIQNAFGCYGHTFFQFCRSLERFSLTCDELAILQCLVFYTYDRPLIKERTKVEQIQSKFFHILRLLCAKNHANEPMFFSRLILNMMKLRALDALSKLSYLTVWL